MIQRIKDKFFTPIEIYSLIFIRIAFGFLMFCNSIDYFIDGVIADYFLRPEFLFKYYGFEWINPLPPALMYLLFASMSLLAIFIMIGLFYRTAIFLFLLCFTYVFLLEKVLYLNHYYMIIIFGFLLFFMPANRYFSVDSTYLNPRIKTKTIPAWSVILLKIQLEIILIYAGLVKINPDWLHFYPLKIWFSDGHGDFFGNIYVIAIASYASILIHIIGAPLLFFKRTRIWIFLFYALFHSINAYIFNVKIGIFPWLTLAMTTIFFAPNWPLQFANFVKSFWNLPNFSAKKIAEIYRNAVNQSSKINALEHFKISTRKKNIIFSLIIIWSIFQILLPLRKYLYEGNQLWHQQGYYFSWQMKLFKMEIYNVSYKIKDNVTQEFIKEIKFVQSTPFSDFHLAPHQIVRLRCKPDLHLQYAHFLKKSWAEKTGHDVSVYATVPCSLNGRKPVNLIDPNIDLGSIKEDFSDPKWILPLDKNSKVGEYRK